MYPARSSSFQAGNHALSIRGGKYPSLKTTREGHATAVARIRNSSIRRRFAPATAFSLYELLHEKSEEKQEVLREITGTVRHRKHLDNSINFIGKLLFGAEKGPSTLEAVRPPGQPLVDDWDCLKQMVRIFESHCGSLTQYGMRHMRAFANICNSGTPGASMKRASMGACGGYNSARWSPLAQGYSA